MMIHKMASADKIRIDLKQIWHEMWTFVLSKIRISGRLVFFENGNELRGFINGGKFD
jgi:hypothetical protein